MRPYLEFGINLAALPASTYILHEYRWPNGSLSADNAATAVVTPAPGEIEIFRHL